MRSSVLADRLRTLIDDFQAEVDDTLECQLGEELIGLGQGIDRLESVSAQVLRRFDKAREFASDGAASSVAWMRWKRRGVRQW